MSNTARPSTLLEFWRSLRFPLRAEVLLLLASVGFTLTCNGVFWRSLLVDRDMAQPASWAVALAFFIAISAVHFILLAAVCHRWLVKPLLALLIAINAFAVYYIGRYTVYLDPSMLRNVLHTDFHEVRELMSWAMLPQLLLYAVLPLALLSRVEVMRVPFPRALWLRLAWLLGAVALGVGVVLIEFQDISATMRNNKEIRYLITPANYIYSTIRVASSEARGVAKPLASVGTDAVQSVKTSAGRKPTLLVLVIGETARAANWGLNGYERQTTPELAQLMSKGGLVNFPQASSCGTNTEVSLPCMFSAIGRRDYDESRIRGSESLLHVLKHAGIRSVWLDNQGGCKGVCAGLESWTANAADFPSLCPDHRCFDEVMLRGAERLLAEAAKAGDGDLVLVLHQMGNHGPAYFKRYPPNFARFTPTCEHIELGKCSREEIVNAYDNALTYTDHLLAATIAMLQTQTSHDAAMIYVSDHGESLGENNLYLHGVPYSIAPDTQTRVPMLMWLSPGFSRGAGIKLNCLRQRAANPVSHDHLFHTALGLLDVRTSVYEPALDFVVTCR